MKKNSYMYLKYLTFVFILMSTRSIAGSLGKELNIMGYLFDQVIIAGTTNMNKFQLSYNEKEFTDIQFSTEERDECLQIDIPARNIQAESKLMLEDFLDLIHADKNPTINISLDDQSLNDLTSKHVSDHQICLTMNGVPQVYKCLLEVEKCYPDGLCLNGKLNAFLTDFGIDPPRKFFGIVKVENKVFISFKLLLSTKKKKPKIEI